MASNEKDDGSISTRDAQQLVSPAEQDAGKIIEARANIAKPAAASVEFDDNDSSGMMVAGANAKNAVKGEKTVQIAVKEFVQCKIGPIWYRFRPDKVYNVTESVKQVLFRRGVLTVI